MFARLWRCLVVSAVLALVTTPLARAQAGPSQIAPGHDEADLNARRAEWIEQIHRAAPGTNWREIESANRLEALFMRQARAQLAPSGGEWIERGAQNVTGRTYDCAIGSDNLLYVGSANGGLFRGPETGGTSWTPLMDNVGYGVEHVVTLGGPPPRLVVASNSRLYVSPDGGATWSVPTGLPEAIWNVARLVREADNTNFVYAMVEGWIWTGVAYDHNWHLLRSSNGGASFTRVYTVPLATRPDIWISRTGAGPLYLAAGNQLLKSIDHGSSFTVVGTLPATGDIARLAGSEAGAPTFYCTLRTANVWTIYVSLNGGVNWLPRGRLSDYYGTLHASITNPNLVYVGGVDCYRSLNAAQLFVRLNTWDQYYGNPQQKLHADIMGLTSVMRDVAGVPTERVYIHTDGGTFLTTAAGVTPDNITRVGFKNAQYYGTLTSGTDPMQVFAGSQDQGYQVSTPAPTTSVDFTQVISGDYAHLVSSWPDRTRMVFSVYPAFVLVQAGPPSAPALETTNFPGAPGFKFLPATAADPADASSVLVGARQLWRAHRNAANNYTWTAFAQDFDHGDGDVVGAIATAPGDPNRWYVATYNGRMWYSTNAGATFTESGIPVPQSHYFAGSGLVVSPSNPLVAWVCGAGYSGPAVYKTTNGGANWVSMGAGLPSTLAFSIALDADETPYVATQAGPFRWGGLTWDNLLLTTCCAPVTDYWNVESVPAMGAMRFATYGRGIWDYVRPGIAGAPGPRAASGLALSAAPNPAARTSVFAFKLPAPGSAKLELFDVTGRRVRLLLDESRAAGEHRLPFDGRDDAGLALRGGLYVARLQTAAGIAVTRLTIAR